MIEGFDATPPPEHSQLGEPVAVYRYERASGDLAFAVARFEPKEFRPAQLKDGRWVWNLTDAPPLLYRLPRIDRALEDGETIWVVDGEKDADALEAAGVAATCCARAQGWTLEHAEQLTGARHIRIVADRDGGTGERQAREVAARLVEAGAIASTDIELVQAAAGKDSHDHLAAGLSLDAFEPLEPELEHRHSWQPVDLVEAGAAVPERPSIAGYTYPGRIHLHSGETESLKSWAALVACKEEITSGRRVIYVDFENGAAAILERLRALGIDDEQIRDRFIYIAPEEPASDPAVLADLLELIATQTPSLIVLDSLIGLLELHGADPNVGVDVQRVWRKFIEPLRDTAGSAVILLDHVAKSKDTRGRYAIGSERKASATEVHIGFELTQPFGRGRTGRAKLTVHKDRPGYLPRPRLGELELTSDPATGAITSRLSLSPSDEPDAFKPTVLMQRVSHYLSLQPTPLPRSAVEKAVKGNVTYIRRAIDALTTDGFVQETPGPNKARLVQHVRLYHEARPSSSKLVPGSSMDELDPGSSSSSIPPQGVDTLDVDEREIERLADALESQEQP